MNQKSILFLFLLCFGALTSFSQITSTESFDAITFPPTGWSIKPTMTPQNAWRRQTSPSTNPNASSHSGTAMARFARNQPNGTKQLLVSRAVDYNSRGTSAANLSFWIYRDIAVTSDTDSIRVFVNTSDTLNGTEVYLGTIARNRTIAVPDTQATNGWYQYTYSIPTTFTGTNTNYFIFEGTSGLTAAPNGQNTYIDDIIFDEFPNVCTGTPNIGTIVNTSGTICGGSGSATFNVSSPITGVIGVSYSWQESSSPTGPWTNVGTNSTTYTTGTLTATTYYQCIATCSYSALDYTTPVDSAVVSSNPLPVISVTPPNAVLCPGTSTVTLYANGAATYSWSPAAGLSATTGDTVVASPFTTTTYVVTGTAADGCVDTAHVTVSQGTAPNIGITATPNDTVCVGTQIILNSTPGGTGGNNTYLWSDGKTTRRDTMIVTATTTLSVIVTNTAGCSSYDSITVVATPPSVADFNYTSTGNTITFTDASTTATSWAWDFGDGNGSSLQNPTYTYTTPGTYTVTLIIAGGGCNDDTVTKVIMIAPEGLSNNNVSSQLRFYPNPVNDQLIISMNHQTIESISIHNSVGEKVISSSIQNSDKSIKVSTIGLSSGIYFAEIKVNGQIVPFKFIKQ